MEVLTDTIMIRLRTVEGLDLERVGKEFGGEEIVRKIKKGVDFALKAGMAIISGGSEKGGGVTLRLTDPEGFLFADEIISNIFYELGEEE